MSREIEMDPRYFAKMWCFYKGDLFAFYYGMHKNYTVASIITLYKRVKRVVPKLPTMVLKNEDYEVKSLSYFFNYFFYLEKYTSFSFFISYINLILSFETLFSG